MLDAAEAARRRELQGRAYTPGGSLTDAEIAELRDLDERNLAALPSVAPTAPPAPPSAAPTASVAPPEPADQPVLGAQLAASDPGEAAIPAPRAGQDGHQASVTPRTRRWLLPLVAVLAVLVGLGAGWLLFGNAANRATMSAAQQEAWSDLEASGDYDPGSIHLVGEKFGATTWVATQEAAKRTCIVLTKKGLDPASACRSSTGDYQGFDLQVNLDYTEDGDQYMLFAMLIEDVGGTPVTVIQRQNMTDNGWDWRSQYNEDELAQVDVFEDAGFDGEWLTLIGYDGAVPVWLYQGERTCLMVVEGAGDIAQQCGELTTDPDMPLQLAVGDVIYSVVDSNRGPSLSIIRSSAPTQVICDSATGDCQSIDDTTGEVD